MKPRLVSVLLAALLGLGPGVGSASELSSPVAVPPAPAGALSNSERHWLASAAVGDKFLIQVRLPEKYEPGKQEYPVIVVLDGDY